MWYIVSSSRLSFVNPGLQIRRENWEGGKSMRYCCKQVGHGSRQRLPEYVLVRHRCSRAFARAWLGSNRVHICHKRTENSEVMHFYCPILRIGAGVRGLVRSFNSWVALWCRILDAASDAGKERCRRLSTAVLNQVIQEALTLKQPPTSHGGKKGRVYFCTQVNSHPKIFLSDASFACCWYMLALGPEVSMQA